MVTACLDPGHGGADRGAVAGDFNECSYNERITRLLADELDARGIGVRLTREVGQNPWFFTRGLRSRGCACVVSLHVNASANPDQRGLEVYHWPGSLHGARLAHAIAVRCPVELIDAPRRSPRIYSTTDAPEVSDDWLQRPRRVLRWHRPPAVLVELGYCTNAADLAYLEWHAGNLARCIAGGIAAWLVA